MRGRRAAIAVLLGALELLAPPAFAAAKSTTAAKPTAKTQAVQHAAVLGWWHGVAEFQGARLELQLHFEQTGTALRASITSPDLMLLEKPLVDVRGPGRQVSFITPDEHPLRFEGLLEGDSLRGRAEAPRCRASSRSVAQRRP